MTWQAAEAAWNLVLHDIEHAQRRLSCTWSNAWFRGLESADFELKPTLMRRNWLDIPAAERPSPARAEPPEKLQAIITRLKHLRGKMRDMHTAGGNTSDLAEIKINYGNLRAQERAIKAELSEARRYKALLRLGERDAFINFQFRSASTYQNSWHVLAEMQHYQVPTRLLDWTDALVSGLYFALNNYRTRLEKFWFDERKGAHRPAVSIPYPSNDVVKDLPEPALCVLNPYHLSKFSVNRDRIWDISLDGSLDYYNCFIEEKSWPFENPIPIYSPWRSERIAAQRGMFLVWGYNRNALENIVTSGTILDRIHISRHAAIGGVKHLRQLFGLDRFGMFRDLDSLGARVRREFLHDPSDKEEDFA